MNMSLQRMNLYEVDLTESLSLKWMQKNVSITMHVKNGHTLTNITVINMI